MTVRGHALGVAAGLLLDRALGDPPDAWHPVAAFGTAMGRVERHLYADRRLPGVAYALVGVGLGAGAGLVLQRLGRVLPGGGVLAVATAVGVACAGRTLRGTSVRIEERLLADDLRGARTLLPWLVGRDPDGLDEAGVSAAVVESLAENTVDAVVAPVLWGLVVGAPGVLAHRAVNTMDAMVGHRNERYRRFGWAAARLDDVMAWVPARVFAALVAVSTGRALPGVLRIVARDAPAHPSPNAGVAESAVAAALGVRLGGPLRYDGAVELRPRLGSGPPAGHSTIARARRLVGRVELALFVVALAVGVGRRRDARGSRGRRTRTTGAWDTVGLLPHRPLLPRRDPECRSRS